MLQVIREHTQGIIVWIILGLVILSLGSFILYGYSPESSKNYVAKVNGEAISQNEYQRSYSQFQQNMGANFSSDPQFLDYVKHNIVNGLVDRELIHQQLDAAGFRVGNAQLNKQIETTPYFLDTTGKFSVDTYHQVLQRAGLSPQAFEQQIAYDFSYQQLRQAVESSAFVLGYEVAEQMRLEGQERDIGYLTIPHASYFPSVKVGVDEVQNYYAAHTSQFMTEEAVKIQYIELAAQDLAQKAQVSDAELKQYYDENKQQYSKQDTTAAEKKIKEIEARARNGESFAKLAEEFSQDPGSAKNGGDLGFFGRGAMVKAFEDAVYKLKPGEISKPVKTEFGIHLIKLEEIKGDQRRARHILIKASTVTPEFNEIKEKVRQDLQAQKAEHNFFELANKLDNLTYQNQDSLEPAAEQLGLKVQESEFFTRQGGPQLLHNPQVITAAFSDAVLKQAQNSEVIKLSSDHVLVLRLKDHRPAQQKPLKEVSAGIEVQLRNEKSTAEASTQAKALYAKLLSGATPVLAPGLTWQRPGYIGRHETAADKAAAKAVVAEAIRQTGFRMPKPVNTATPGYSLQQLPNGDSVIVALYGVRDPTGDIPAATREAKLHQLAQTQAQEDVQALLSYQRKHSEIELNLPKNAE
ncbi:MAG: SurA N-terminal domain-containing protein [Gammaproteobacteria bacterium]|nr:SurA N-terminal domain-containing protein [Gammaproteobacteria bacterium]